MTTRERILAAIRCTKNAPIPVTTHWWGLYKFAHAGLLTGYEADESGRSDGGRAKKKQYPLDIGIIYDHLEQSLCLFGNLDSVYVLQLGTEEQVAEETLRQLKACSRGGFIMSNGCPISFGTPAGNIHAMIDTVRRFR